MPLWVFPRSRPNRVPRVGSKFYATVGTHCSMYFNIWRISAARLFNLICLSAIILPPGQHIVSPALHISSLGADFVVILLLSQKQTMVPRNASGCPTNRFQGSVTRANSSCTLQLGSAETGTQKWSPTHHQPQPADASRPIEHALPWPFPPPCPPPLPSPLSTNYRKRAP